MSMRPRQRRVAPWLSSGGDGDSYFPTRNGGHAPVRNGGHGRRPDNGLYWTWTIPWPECAAGAGEAIGMASVGATSAKETMAAAIRIFMM